MPTIQFYRQERYDGGTRTGLGIDQQPTLHDFREGDGDSDPALLWYVDVSLSGANLPSKPQVARAWLADHQEPIQAGLRAVAERLEVGLDDTEALPFRLSLRGLPRGVRGEISLSAARRLAAGEIARHLCELAEEWPDALHRLNPLAAV